jgi:hypothetical protein
VAQEYDAPHSHTRGPIPKDSAAHRVILLYYFEVWSGHGGTRTHLEHTPRTIGRRPPGSGSATRRPAGSIVPVGKVHTGAPGAFGCASVLPLLELAARRVDGPKLAGRRLCCHNSAGHRLEEHITYLFPRISSPGILAVTRRHTVFRHFHMKWVE